MIPILIHSHWSNHLRRKAIRDTWLSVSTLHIRDILHSVTDATLTRILNLNKEKIHFPHIFIIGNSNQRQNQSYSKIKKEANLYNDIVMVDLDDQYKNILYKHLTIYDWLMKNCHQLSYFIKMDDDVFVNLKRLSKHLIVNFGLENSMKISKPFIFCNTVEEYGKPERSLSNKWFVTFEEYPFNYFPKYCAGALYISNLAAVELINKQAREIPRFWIDDVYMTGILIFGLENTIKWADFKKFFEFSSYNYSQFSSNNSIKLNASFISSLDKNMNDFYKNDVYIVLHAHKSIKNANYDIDCHLKKQKRMDDEKFYNYCVHLFYRQAQLS
jgi:hypothetical protein